MSYLTGQVLTQADIAALFTSGTYTPTLGAMAIGTGGTPVNSAKYTFVGFPAGGELTVEGMIRFGTTAPTLPGASAETISLPAGYTAIDTNTTAELMGGVTLYDVSGGILCKGFFRLNSSTTVRIWALSVSGANVIHADVTATVPFTWAVSDEIHYRFALRCTGP